MENFGTHTSTYKLSYSHQPKEAFVLKHHAPPKSMSCHFHPHQVNKNLRLRGKQLIAAPELPMTLAVPHNVPPDFPQSTVLAVWCDLMVKKSTLWKTTLFTLPGFSLTFINGSLSDRFFYLLIFMQCTFLRKESFLSVYSITSKGSQKI